MVDLFVKGDLDFKYQKKFSKKFHLVTKDKEKLVLLLENKPLDDLIQFPEMEVEICKKQCLFRLSENTMNMEEAKQFIGLTHCLLKMLD